MEELHEKRGAYMKQVRNAAAEDLLKNGLELESVSLTGLDQTNMEYFNPSNAFDAEGLTRLTEQIELRKKMRNDIEQDTMIQIRSKNLEAERKSLTIDRDSEAARLEQERELEIRRTSQRTELARQKAEKEQQSEQAQLLAKQEAEKTRIAMERALEEDRIAKEQGIRRWRSDAAKRSNSSSSAPSPAGQIRHSRKPAAADQARARRSPRRESVFGTGHRSGRTAATI